jgi:hypothetical protein
VKALFAIAVTVYELVPTYTVEGMMQFEGTLERVGLKPTIVAFPLLRVKIKFVWVSMYALSAGDVTTGEVLVTPFSSNILGTD